jgi:MFS family permease
MAMAHCLMASAHLLFAFAVPGSLYVGSVILGISYGIHFSTMVPTASELFGWKHFGVIYNFLTMASPLGSFLFSGVITGYLYDQEAKKKIAPDARIVDTFLNNLHNNYNVVDDDHVQVLECIGAHCFKVTFIIMACVCGLGVLVSIVLTIRIRRVYLSLYGPSTPPIQSTSDLKSSASITHPHPPERK